VTRHAVINGRFLSQEVTGVQRFAREVTRALDEMVADGDASTRGWAFELLAPPGATLDLPLRAIPVRTVGATLRGQLWEQVTLARAVGSRFLVNLGNTAPVTRRAQLVVIHDASVWAIPTTFTRAFRTWYRLLLPALGRLCQRVATVSEFSRGELRAHAHIPPGKVTVVWAGSDHVHATAPDGCAIARLALDGRPFVLAVSSDAPHKRFALVEAAMAHESCAHLDLVIVGGAGGRTLTTGERAAHGRARRVGRVSDGELRALYERALCLVFPSTYEGFGLPPLEAMASGCPVIVSRHGAIPEVCGDAALYLDGTGAGALAALIARLAGDPALRDTLAARGRARAAAFTWRRTARALVGALDASGAPSRGADA
jgi:glycosyltransferase involved in cell wall biosynthesis